MARVGLLLERAKAALRKLSLLSAMLKTTPTPYPPSEVGVDSVEHRDAKVYGCFSPRVGDSLSSLSALPSAPSTTEVEAIAVLETLVLQIMHESFEGFV
jgi:hypothetical protein